MILKKKRLGKWQIESLDRIAKHEVCCHRSLLELIKGTAAKWDRKYKRSLARAIAAHNNGTAINSPVDPYFMIVEDKKMGYKLIPRI